MHGRRTRRDWLHDAAAGVVESLVESLESRRLFAFSAAAYFPMNFGNTWNYTGTTDAQPITSATTTSAAGTLGTAVVTRLNTTIVASGIDDDNTSTYYALDSGGLKLLRIDGTTGGSDAHLTFGTPLRLLNATFDISQVIDFGSVPISVTLSDPQVGTLSGSGTGTGDSTVSGIERVTLPDGRFINAIKLVFHVDFSVSGKFNGSAWTLSGTETDTLWLGFGLGVVKQTETAPVTFSVPSEGIEDTEDSSFQISLSGSSLLPPDSASLAGGVLTLNGGIAGDALSVTSTPGKIVATRGGVSEEFAASSVTSINVFGFDGNDSVSIGAGVPGVYVDAGTGNDVATGGDGPDTFTGGAGKDRLDGGAGDDRVAGNGGHDSLVGNLGNDRIYGGNENDTMEGGAGTDRLWGGAGDDVMGGNGSNDKLYGEDGNDLLSGGTQNDLLSGGAGNDQIFGGAGHDSAFGDAGADVLALLDGEVDNGDGGADLDTATADASDILSQL